MWKQIGQNVACPKCKEIGRDSKDNHGLVLETPEGKQYIFCWRKLHENNYTPVDGRLIPTIEKPIKSLEDLEKEVKEVDGYPIKDLTSRGISRVTAERFNVRTALSEYNGHDHIQYCYPLHHKDGSYHYRIRNVDPKFFYNMGDGKEALPFGYEQCLGNDVTNMKLVITEDQDSAMSAYEVVEQFMSDRWKGDIKPAVMALPNGAGSVDILAHPDVAKIINKYKGTTANGIEREVVICMDNDEEGRKAEAKILKMYPWVKTVTTPDGYKDLNDLMQAGRKKEIFNILKRASIPQPKGVVSMLDVIDDAVLPVELGASYPLPTLTKEQFGQRDYMLMSIGGGTGSGKTLIAHEFAAHNYKEHDEHSLMVMLEETNPKTARNVAGKLDSLPYHRPDCEYDVDTLRTTVTDACEYIHLWDSSDDQERRFNTDAICETIRHLAVTKNLKNVFFDNATAVTQHLTPTEINTEINRIAGKLAGLAEEFNLRIFIFSHLNPPQGGKSHEEGAPVREREFTGSRALQRWSHMMCGFVRNKHDEQWYEVTLLNGDEIKIQGKNLSYFEVLKDREFGLTCKVHTCYLPNGRLVEYDPASKTESADDIDPYDEDEAF